MRVTPQWQDDDSSKREVGPRQKVKTSRVETMGLEPTTPCLQSRCSSQLSYVPDSMGRKSLPGLEPSQPGTPSAPIVCALAWRDSSTST